MPVVDYGAVVVADVVPPERGWITGSATICVPEIAVRLVFDTTLWNFGTLTPSLLVSPVVDRPKKLLPWPWTLSIPASRWQ